jgi:hypothetical protein
MSSKSQERPTNQNKKMKGNKQMNSLCKSAEILVLPVLGLDVAKKSVQAELRIKERKVRFGFGNNAKGFAQLARLLKEHKVQEVWAGLEATGPTARLLRCGCMLKLIE